MVKRCLYLLVVFSLLSGCVKFSPTAVVRTLPNDIADRNNLLPTAQLREHMEELIGAILIEIEDPTGQLNYELSTQKYLTSDAKPVLKSYSENEGTMVDILIDNKADVKLQALAFGGASLGAEQKMQFLYSDVADVWINDQYFDNQALRNEANRTVPNNIRNRWLIQGTLLSSIQTKTFTKVSGGLTKTVVGTGISAEGEVYSSASAFTKDFALHLTLRHIDLFKGTDQEVQQTRFYFTKTDSRQERALFDQMIKSHPLPAAKLALLLKKGLMIKSINKTN